MLHHDLFSATFKREGIAIARGFSASQKETIRNQLIKEGRRLFGKYGLKKTNIAQLAEAAGISPAAFYKFFGSKEELYFLIFEEEAANMQALMLDQIRNPESQSVTSNFQNALISVSKLYQENPLMEQLFLAHDLNQLLLTIPQSNIDAHVVTGYKNLAPAFESLQQEGKVISEDPKVLITVMQLYFLLNEQRSNFDGALFDRAMKLLAGWIAQGFTGKAAVDHPES
jgi:AcrR family transcriptional regulator